MKRDLNNLANKKFDLLVIGGGIYGACVAWDASLRGLSVALVEKKDFGSATSANSLKIIHGGLRYLQNADFRRMRESIIERRILLKIAPNLVHPMPVLIPTYGHGMKGKEALWCALKINDLVSCDRNRYLDDPQKHIPSGRAIARHEIQKLIPGLSNFGLTGGIIFHDAQVYNSERLTLAFIKSAVEKGAEVSNYTEAIDLLQSKGKVVGAKVRDVFTGCELDIQAEAIINASGPWINQVLGLSSKNPSSLEVLLAKAINLVTRPLFEHSYAVGLSSQAQNKDQTKLFKNGSRLFFVAPWRGKSLIGTAYSPYRGDPDLLSVTKEEIADFIRDINDAYPTAELRIEDIKSVYQGLLPRSGICPQTGNIQLTKQYQLYDHSQDGLAGLLSVVGVKYTTARGVAEKAVDWVFKVQGKNSLGVKSPLPTLWGGEIHQFQAFLQDAISTYSRKFSKDTITRLVYNYGSSHNEVIKLIGCNSFNYQNPFSDLEVYKAEVKYAVHQEMAQKLSDFVFRREELGTVELPKETIVKECAEVMGRELGWSINRIQREIEEINIHQIDPIKCCRTL